MRASLLRLFWRQFEITIALPVHLWLLLRRLNTVLLAISSSTCFKLDKQTWRRKKQWYTEDDFSKSTLLKILRYLAEFLLFSYYKMEVEQMNFVRQLMITVQLYY